jgi:acyl-CoA thioesterase-1
MRGPLNRALIAPAAAIIGICYAISGCCCAVGDSSLKSSSDRPQQASPKREPPKQAAPRSGPVAPVVMFVGDSFTVGSGPVARWQTYATESARRLGWQPIIAGAGGTGYLNTGRVDRTFRQSWQAELSWRPAPNLLIISGGHNDQPWAPRRVRTAAAELLHEARSHWPTTRIVMIGPIWLHDTPAKAYRIRDTLSEVARHEGITFLDPLQDTELTHTPTAQLLPDRIHPTAKGHLHLADWLVEAMGRQPAG